MNRTTLSFLFATTLLIGSFGVALGAEDVDTAEASVQVQAELSELEKQIAAKTAELESLRQKAAELRTKSKSAPKNVARLQAHLKAMPKDLQPLDSDNEEGMFARDRATKWLQEHLVGRTVSFTSVLRVRISSGKQLGQYGARAAIDEARSPFDAPLNSHVMVTSPGTVRCGGAGWEVYYVVRRAPFSKVGLEEATAKRLLKLNGKTVTVTGKVVPLLTNYGFKLSPNSTKPGNRLYLALGLGEMFIDGVDQPKE